MSDPYRTPGEVERDIVIPKRFDWWDTFCAVFWAAIALAAAAAVAFPVFRAITADGKADYCFVERETANNYYTGKYLLRQHVPWGSDRTLAMSLNTTEDVRQEAARYGCEIR